MIKRFFYGINILKCAAALMGSAVLAFGIYHIHSVSGVTEGGALGLTLLLEHWLNISPAVSGLIINILCYILGWRTFGKVFLIYSGLSAFGFSAFYSFFERFPHFWPELYSQPLASAFFGALFVGVGVGLCELAGGAPTGDDALAMSLSHKTNIGIQWIYLISDLLVLILSLSYIPFKRIVYSLLTVVLSGQIIGVIVKLPAFFSQNRKNNSGR